jgi:hypothetical protein
VNNSITYIDVSIMCTKMLLKACHLKIPNKLYVEDLF